MIQPEHSYSVNYSFVCTQQILTTSQIQSIAYTVKSTATKSILMSHHLSLIYLFSLENCLHFCRYAIQFNLMIPPKHSTNIFDHWNRRGFEDVSWPWSAFYIWCFFLWISTLFEAFFKFNSFQLIYTKQPPKSITFIKTVTILRWDKTKKCAFLNWKFVNSFQPIKMLKKLVIKF